MSILATIGGFYRKLSCYGMEIHGSTLLTIFTPKSKKYILPTF